MNRPDGGPPTAPVNLAGLASRELDAGLETGVALARASELVSQLEAWPPGAGTNRAQLLLELAGAYLDGGEPEKAAAPADEAFDTFVLATLWEPAVRAARALYLADADAGANGAGLAGGADGPGIPALGQAIWLAVSMPVEPELTLAVLQHLIDEVPEDADGAAVAAATAGYVVDLRCPDDDTLQLFAGRMLADVARRHSGVASQDEFDAWVSRLELDDPGRFLVRLRNVVDVLVQDHWRFDRDAVRASMPD